MVNGIKSTESKEFEFIRRHSNGYLPMVFNDEILNSTSLRCNEDAISTDTKILTVNAGDKITFMLDNYYGEPNHINHPGPQTVYMSRAPPGSIASYDGSGDWFKVYESGLCLPSPDTDDVEHNWCLENRTSIEFTIPQNLPAGEYLARPESLALHYAYKHVVQVFTSCAQLRVISNGTGTPGPLVKIPGHYARTEPGLSFDIRHPAANTTYVMPGPKVWLG